MHEMGADKVRMHNVFHGIFVKPAQGESFWMVRHEVAHLFLSEQEGRAGVRNTFQDVNIGIS